MWAAPRPSSPIGRKAMELISDLTFDLEFVSIVLREIECGSRARPQKEMSDVPRGLGDGTPKLCAVRGARSRGLGLVEIICDNFGSSKFSHAYEEINAHQGHYWLLCGQKKCPRGYMTKVQIT